MRSRLVAVVGVPVVVGEGSRTGWECRNSATVSKSSPAESRCNVCHPVDRVVPGAPFRRGLEVALRAERAVPSVVGRVQGLRLRPLLDAERSVAPARDRPHLCAAEGVELLDGAVRHGREVLGGVSEGLQH